MTLRRAPSTGEPLPLRRHCISVRKSWTLTSETGRDPWPSTGCSNRWTCCCAGKGNRPPSHAAQLNTCVAVCSASVWRRLRNLPRPKPKIDLEIEVSISNSADISKTSVTVVQELGKALSTRA